MLRPIDKAGLSQADASGNEPGVLLSEDVYFALNRDRPAADTLSTVSSGEDVRLSAFKIALS